MRNAFIFHPSNPTAALGIGCALKSTHSIAILTDEVSPKSLVGLVQDNASALFVVGIPSANLTLGSIVNEMVAASSDATIIAFGDSSDVERSQISENALRLYTHEPIFAWKELLQGVT